MQEETRNCEKCKASFTIDESDSAFYEKMEVPLPILCPECRFKRLSVWRNEHTLYSRKCDLCGRSIIAMYNPKSLFTVYCDSCWRSDKWDPFSYGMAYDESRPFFEQLKKLLIKVPKVATYSSNPVNINSEYVNMAGGKEALKNCYLLFNSAGCEDVMYSRGIRGGKDLSDGYYGIKLERCYEIVNIEESSGIIFGQNTSGSLDSVFVLNTHGCQNCFGCVNLRYKNYYFFNEPLPRDEYKKRVSEIMGSYRKMQETRKKFEEFSLKFPRRENNNLKTSNSFGDYLFETRNIYNSFEVVQAENCKYIYFVKGIKDSRNVIGFGFDSELLLETAAVGYSNRIIGCCSSDYSHHLEYCFGLKHSEYCLGCDGLKNAKYSILNKRYSEEEYFNLHNRIVSELKEKGLYGLSMPPDLAPFAYNEAIGQDNLPLTKEEAVSQGFRWEEGIQMTKGKETMKPEQIPDHIKDVLDSITDEILVCITCGRNYKIIKPELAFYRKMVLPVPRQCFNCRHLDRIKRRGPFILYNRKCDHCEKTIKTNFSPDRPEIVYCEDCYRVEVV
jgi:DNA-directed RNA polymerase subunit RPC12/RpoP